jgi:hypothetical protein
MDYAFPLPSRGEVPAMDYAFPLLSRGGVPAIAGGVVWFWTKGKPAQITLRLRKPSMSCAL